ncbi:MAG: phospho-sugar mutase [Candidatus Solibacter sp.]|nr:phospho-sugar mutase [Candidatus Solibacter sp.]
MEREQWTELTDRFYRTLEFGTGGLRGRTIGKYVTQAEVGGGSTEVPEHPAVGTNTMNFFTVSIAIRGLVKYVMEKFPSEPARVAIAYDTRHYSHQFAHLAASIVEAHGGTAYLFTEPSPTPELSFAVRQYHAHAGVVLTASHNPPHDNGCKVYFSDGAQITEPHASGITAAVEAVRDGAETGSPRGTGHIVAIGKTFDETYIAALKNLILCPEVFGPDRPSLRVAYSPLHGTGGKIVPQTLQGLGFDVAVVPEQAVQDGRFPTVTSPNPENKEALSLVIALAERTGAIAALVTDPDCDRLAAALRNDLGEYECLSGNQVGSLIAHYRLEQLFRRGVLNSSNAQRAAIIKTFVTTDLMQCIAAARGVKCVDTLTGFKYIGAKLREYEEMAGGRGDTSAADWNAKLLQSSTYCVFAAEESLGYLAEDYARDKDAAGSAVMFAELLAFAAANHTTALDTLNQIYVEHGYYGDRLHTRTFEGGDGLRKINTLLASYEADPPQMWAEKRVLEIQNYGTHDFFDADGSQIPRELMLIFRLADRCSVTVRASGTEPKIKFYLSAQEPVESVRTVGSTKERVESTIGRLLAFANADVDSRLVKAGEA